MKYVSTEPIRVWERMYDEMSDSMEWTLVETVYRVGTTDELFFWRALPADGISGKSFFYGPEDYFLHCGVDPGEHNAVIMKWREKQRLLQQLDATAP